MTEYRPLFSIVIANYNGAAFLEDAILSILEQSCNDFELILIDGGSNDNSVNIIKKYEKKLAFWVSEKDSGQSAAFNKGFNKAKGEFFFWINADDLLLPDSIKLAKQNIQKNPTNKWFVANTIFINSQNNIMSCSRGPKWHNLAIKNGPVYVFGPTSIFHRSLFYEAGGFNESLHYTMDTDLWMKFVNNKHQFKRIRHYFWAFRLHKASKTTHSFSGPVNKKYAEERKRIARENKHRYNRFGVLLQLLIKILGGTFCMSKVDTILFKGKSINILRNK